jgi:hypothetical protein
MGATDGFGQGGEAGEEGLEGTAGKINRELMYNKFEQDAEEANHEEYSENARDAFYGNGGGSEGKISPDELKELPVDQLMQFPPKAQPNLSGNSSRNKSKSQSQNRSARVNENGSMGQTGSFQGQTGALGGEGQNGDEQFEQQIGNAPDMVTSHFKAYFLGAKPAWGRSEF